jgi:hypothetical protein
MKNRKIFIVGLICYAFIYIATSYQKEPNNSCENQILTWFNINAKRQQSGTFKFNTNQALDSVIYIITDSSHNLNWNTIADSICVISKNNCNRSGLRLLIANRQNPNVANWQTPYGVTVVNKICP